ncbi:protein FAM83B [Ornithorhynchus anatinus]|uniref:Family with sequence similarity 83 member B n=1 Tax=Ornithorhynchus anatinus TaxID=9258 RepID=F7G0F7_ORNAN|nr:protein FAM83B [Ornithorhynchus anatinus]
MESSSLLSSLNDECKSDNYIEPHYKEWYRVAVDTLIESGLEAYHEFLVQERFAEFLAEEEINYILNNAKKFAQSTGHASDSSCDDTSSSGTYWPMESDVEAPNLDLGWPYVMPGLSGSTHIDLLFHPPRAHLLTIKETIRKMIKEARKVIAIVMDIFTDVDIFKEIIEASTRGISVYLLLDDSNFSHFLGMAEKQGCQIQRLRNIRVRTVKGQDYLSKTGAKFYGKMQQKFLLVDCQKVMYGSYSYMWSFEKAHLSMVQIITGQLVESFDEEFRTLYARSCVPTPFAQEESVRVKNGKRLWENGSYQRSVSSLASISSQRNLFSRQDNFHKLDSSYLKSRGFYGVNEYDKFHMRGHGYKPHFVPNFNGPQKIRQYQPSGKNENWKRHSYAGEQPETTPYLLLNRALNRANNPSNHWKMPSDSLSVASSTRGGYVNHRRDPVQSFADRLAQRRTTNLVERNSNVRRSFNGTDNHIRYLQQRMPTLEHTTKSFLRNWRIESYLNDHSETPPDSNGSALGDRFEGYDGSESIKASALYSHSRLRSSIVFKPTLPEQQEVNSCTTGSSNSTIIGSQGSETPKETSGNQESINHTTDPSASDLDTQVEPQPDVLTRNNLQVPKDHSVSNHYTNGNMDSEKHVHPSSGGNQQTENLNLPQNETTLKRRSFPMFDNSVTNLDNEGSKHYVYSTLTRNRVRQPESLQAKEDFLKGSKSMHNVANNLEDEDKTNKEDSQNGPTTKSISIAALLDVNKEEPHKELCLKKENKGSPNFLKKGSQKLRSLLSLTPEKKENLAKNKAPAFYRLCSSSDTLVSEGEENQKPKKSEPKIDSPRRKRSSSSNSQGSIHKSKEDITISSPPMPPSDDITQVGAPVCPVEDKFLESAGDASAPRFNTEQIQYQDAKEMKTAVPPERRPPAPSPSRPKPSELIRSRSTDRRVYSRFEPFCKIESAIHPTNNVPNASIHLTEMKSTNLVNNYGRSSTMLNYNSPVYRSFQPNENKFRGFMQKFGNFIHKNK